MSVKQIPIIDLFAGPGGLGEGFTSVIDKNNNRIFKIALSIEKDEFAHKTLTLRSFVRQFPFKNLPKEYYQFVRGEIKGVEELYKLHPKETEAAKKEAWQFTLGNPDTYAEIDKRIREALNNEENFILIGGPPCQAYSLVGRSRRQEKEGLNKEGKKIIDERLYLYREYYRILAVHQPKIFVMENVKGLLSSRDEDELIFNQLVNDLKDPVAAYRKLHGKNQLPQSKYGYKIFSLVKNQYQKDLFEEGIDPRDFIIRSEKFGIPQTRHRVIILGIREDIDARPDALLSLQKPVAVEKVLSGLPNLRSGLSKTKDGKQEWKQALQEIKQLNFRTQIDAEVWENMLNVVNNLSLPRKDKGSLFVKHGITIDYEPEWYLDNKLKGACNHQSRSHIKEDLFRYLFASCFAKVKGHSPKLSDFPASLLPKHENIGLGVKENKFADRFRVQLKGEPSKTITSHISKDGHYYIHYDPRQCRSLTVREAARIQTFPDNYYFCGPRTQQFHQVGNAVPPLLAKQIAELVANLL